jgi:hypothetical protein
MKNIIFRPTSLEVEHLATKPKPAKNYFPDWIKSVPLYANNKMEIDMFGNANVTLKGCMPFLDTFTSGYIQETWCDIYVDVQEKYEYRFAGGPEIMEHRPQEKQHYPAPEGYARQEFTWKQPWIPQLPSGYSMLYVQPFNRYDLPFLNLSAIIDNDTFYMENNTNHPFFIKENFKGIIPKGTPYMQMIPIKRDAWESSFKSYDEMLSLSVRKIRQFFIGGYRKLYWQKKEYN